MTNPKTIDMILMSFEEFKSFCSCKNDDGKISPTKFFCGYDHTRNEFDLCSKEICPAFKIFGVTKSNV